MNNDFIRMPQAIRSTITVEDYLNDTIKVSKMKTVVRDKFTDSSKGCIWIVDYSADTTLELYLSKTIFGDKNTEKERCDRTS